MTKDVFRELTKDAVRILKNKKALNILALDVRDIADFVDYFVIASGSSDVHMKTLLQELEEQLVLPVYKKEMPAKMHWGVLDYGNVMIHVFRDEQRAFYNLERLWNNGKVMRIRAGKE